MMSAKRYKKPHTAARGKGGRRKITVKFPHYHRAPPDLRIMHNVFNMIWKKPIKPILKKRYSKQPLTLYSNGHDVNRITLGLASNNHMPQKGAGPPLEYGGIIGEKGTADVAFHGHDGELHANIMFDVPKEEPKGRVGRIVDLLKFAHDFAKERGAERVVAHAECDALGDPADHALLEACKILDWHCIGKRPDITTGKMMGDFGVYW